MNPKAAVFVANDTSWKLEHQLKHSPDRSANALVALIGTPTEVWYSADVAARAMATLLQMFLKGRIDGAGQHPDGRHTGRHT
jgi:hypothetical protein